MSEKPILFSGEMVRAILDGRKTQTQRVVNFPARAHMPDLSWIASVNQDGAGNWVAWGPKPVTDEFSRMAYPSGGGIKCPYGRPGDLLWVRETWADGVPGCPGGLSYRADHVDPAGDGPAAPMRWRPSIFMPRWASRLTLRVVDVRVERLQEIGDREAIAEGIMVTESADMTGITRGQPTYDFRALWDSINAKRGYSWNSNPWVWVVEFEVVT